jgi:hypothetical protein
MSMHMTLRSLAVLTVAGVAGCDLVDDIEMPTPPPAEDIIDDLEPVDVAQALEDALFEHLQCEEILRPSTIERLRELIHDPSFEDLEAVLTSPQDLATVVSFAGAEVEGAVVVARNLEQLIATGALADVVANGWDGVQCGEPVTVQCTAGAQTSTVGCFENEVRAVSVDLDNCTLGGTVHDGAVTLRRLEADDSRGVLEFEGLALNEIKVLDGSISLRIGDGGATRASLVSNLAYTEHGGPEGGLSCGARLALSSLEVSLDDGQGFVSFAAQRDTADDSIALETFGAHLQLDPSTCACPLAQSGLRLDVPRPLGRAGETARAEISWSSTSDPGLCAEATVALVGWPGDCDGLDVDGDCGRDATARTLSGLFTALCAR